MNNTILIDGIRYHKDRPASCRQCYFWKNRNPIYPGRDADGMAERRSYESYFRDALEFDFLLQQYPYDRETLQEILDLLIDTVCTKREYIRMPAMTHPGTW